MSDRHRITWAAREPPLEPIAVAGVGAPALALARRLLDRDDEHLGRLRGVAASGAPAMLVALGPAEELPWVDGVVYLGRDPLAPALLVPTILRPEVHPSLVERAFLAGAPAGSAPIAVFPSASATLGVGHALPLGRRELSAWLHAHTPS